MRLPFLAACALVAALLLPAAPSGAAPLGGVVLHSLWPGTTSEQVRRDLSLAAQAHSRVVRIDVTWGSLEMDGPGRFDPDYVSSVDAFMHGARTRGMKVIVTLVSSPCWASAAPAWRKLGCQGAWWDRGVGNYPPVRPADYARAARFVTARWGAYMAGLELWNEPNLPDANRMFVSSAPAAEYFRLVRAAYPQARAGDPRVPVLAGAVAYADTTFLDRLYALGIARYEDGISVHPYNEWRSPLDDWQPRYRKYTFGPGIRAMRAAMVRHHDGAAGLWLTEFGWTTARGARWGVTPAQQAQYVGEAFGMLADMPYVRAACVYNLRDKGTDPADPESNFGLVTAGFAPKPAYAALRRALARAGAPSMRSR